MTEPTLTDVTAKVGFGDIDGESLELRRCVCGAEFTPWHVIISIYHDLASPCPECGRKLIFRNQVRVYEVT